MKRLLAGVLALAIPFQADFQDICKDRWIDRAVTAKCESDFKPNAKSFDGGEGLGQATGQAWPWYQRMGWVPKDSTPFQVRPAIMGINRHEGWLEARFRAHGVTDPYENWIATGMAYNGGEKQTMRAIAEAEMAGLEGPEGWLKSLHGAGAKYTPRYIHAKIQTRVKYRQQLAE